MGKQNKIPRIILTFSSCLKLFLTTYIIVSFCILFTVPYRLLFCVLFCKDYIWKKAEIRLFSLYGLHCRLSKLGWPIKKKKNDNFEYKIAEKATVNSVNVFRLKA